MDNQIDKNDVDVEINVPSEQERSVGAIAHLLVLVGFIIPLGNFLAPLIVYVIKKDESPYVAKHAIEAINFQITIFIGMLVSFALLFTIIGIPLGVLGLLTLWLVNIVFVIIAAIRVSDGVDYRYPYCLRLI